MTRANDLLTRRQTTQALADLDATVARLRGVVRDLIDWIEDDWPAPLDDEAHARLAAWRQALEIPQ